MRAAFMTPLVALLLTAPLLAEAPHPITEMVATQLEDTNSSFALVVHFTAAEGNEDRIIKAFRKSVRMTRKEPGNMCYVLSQNSKDPAKFLMYEQWKNLTALDSHLKQPYLRELLPKIEAMIAEPPQIDVNIPRAEPQGRKNAGTHAAEHEHAATHAGEHAAGSHDVDDDH